MSLIDLLLGKKKKEEQARLERERLASELARAKEAEEKRIALEREKAEQEKREREKQERERMANSVFSGTTNSVESIRSIVSGSCFSLSMHVTVNKQPYNGQAVNIPLSHPVKAVIRRDIKGGNIRIVFSDLEELKSKGIIQTNLDLTPEFSYSQQGPDEFATAEINNSYAAVHSGKEYISLFQITRQNGGYVSFLINNLPGDRDFYYLIMLSDKELNIRNEEIDENKQQEENPARPKGLKITRDDMVIEYKAYERCTEYATRLKRARERGYLTPPYTWGDNSFTQMLCKEDCIFCHCPFYDRRLLEELRHNHRTDYDEWVMEHFKNFK